MPMKPQNVSDEVSAQNKEIYDKGGSSFRSNLERNIKFKNSIESNNAFTKPVCQPKPLKAEDLKNRTFGEEHLKNWDIIARLNRRQRFDDSDSRDNFTQELEDRIEADMEIESIFQSVSQQRSLSLGKSLPERPGNPIINDKYFLDESNNIQAKNLENETNKSSKHMPLLQYKEDNQERQDRIMWVNSDILPEMEPFHGFKTIRCNCCLNCIGIIPIRPVSKKRTFALSPELEMQNQSFSNGSLSCSSESSSLESDFSKILINENSQED
jgi:hypothetical protein